MRPLPTKEEFERMCIAITRTFREALAERQLANMLSGLFRSAPLPAHVRDYLRNYMTSRR